MVTVAEVVTPLTNTHNSLHWMVGIVTAMNTTTRKLSVQFRGAAAGASTPGVDYVMSYTPAVGHKVHAISQEERGILVLGTTGPSPAGGGALLAAPAMKLLAAPPDACADPVSTGTYVRLGNDTDGFRGDLVAQGPGLLGVWSMPDLATAIQDAQVLGLIATAEIELTMLHGGPRAVLTLVTTGSDPVAHGEVRRSDKLVIGDATRIALPLGWLDELGYGLCMIGLSDGALVPQAGFSADACVYLTVQRYDS